MANWTKLSDGTWGIQTRTGTTGDRITVTKANGQTARVTLGAFVKRTRWGKVFRVAGSVSRRRPARARPARRIGRRSAVPVARPDYATDVAALPAWDAIVATPEPVDPSVARFLLLNLDDDVTTVVADDDDDGGARLLQID